MCIPQERSQRQTGEWFDPALPHRKILVFFVDDVIQSRQVAQEEGRWVGQSLPSLIDVSIIPVINNIAFYLI